MHIINAEEQHIPAIRRIYGKRRLSTVWQILKFLRG
ncbi:putative acetyltransferase [Klebsiella pneumoniae]|nr:putative acetyltransferase [Klebsiella pneumoniae]